MNLFKKMVGTTVVAAAFVPLAFAAPQTDVKDGSNNATGEYFVIDDSLKFNSPYYRDENEDWSWKHNPLSGSFNSITLEISAFDVDVPDEVDNIYAYDGSDWVLLGALTGSNNAWEFGNAFDLTTYDWAEAQVNAGLQLKVDIDANEDGWLLTLGKSVLSTDGGSAICVPTPGVPCSTNNVPEPGGLPLVALAFGAAYFARRAAKR